MLRNVTNLADFHTNIMQICKRPDMKPAEGTVLEFIYVDDFDHTPGHTGLQV